MIGNTLVLGLVAFIWALVITVTTKAAHRDERAPTDDLGVYWLLVFALYSTLPPLFWLVQGGNYSPYGNGRLYVLQPSPEDVERLLLIVVAYSLGFAICYLLSHKRVPRPAAAAVYAPISFEKMVVSALIAVGFQVSLWLMSAAGLIRTPHDYADSYRVMLELPLVMRQLLKIGSGVASVASLVFVGAVLQRWPKYRSLIFVYIIVALFSFNTEGSRAPLVIAILSLVFAWHILVRPIPLRWWVAGGVLGLVIFTALGLRRDAGSWSGIFIDNVSVGEFDSLWANDVELLRARDGGGLDVPWSARFGEFFTFVPSQFLPFEKQSLSEWFMATFYPEFRQNGGGFVFGIIGQAVIGGLWVEAFIRGAIIGFLSTSAMKWFRSTSTSWWRLPLYLYALTLVFLSVRDTTFLIFSDIAQTAIPAFVLIGFVTRILPKTDPRLLTHQYSRTWRMNID
jgi:oligosaccharide repeat unit polymerase